MWARKTFQFPGRAVSLQLFTQCCFDLLLKNYTEAEIRNSKSSFVRKTPRFHSVRGDVVKEGEKRGMSRAKKRTVTSGRFEWSIRETLVQQSLQNVLCYSTSVRQLRACGPRWQVSLLPPSFSPRCHPSCVVLIFLRNTAEGIVFLSQSYCKISNPLLRATHKAPFFGV